MITTIASAKPDFAQLHHGELLIEAIGEATARPNGRLTERAV
jgi:hypothetical protein